MAVPSLRSSSSFSQMFSDGGTAVARGGGKRRSKGGAAAQGFSNVRHQEGVARQLQHVHAVLLVISQATSNEGLQEKKKKHNLRMLALENLWKQPFLYF